MSIPELYNQVIYGLLMKSKVNQVSWNTTTDNNSFIVYFNKFSLSIRQNHNSNESWINIELIDNNGNRIDGFYIEEGEDDWANVNELYTLARRSALSIDIAIEEMLAELSKEGNIGKKKIVDKSSNNDGFKDDIPF